MFFMSIWNIHIYSHYIPLYINMIPYAKCSMFVYWLGFCHHATCITCHVSRSWKKIQSLLQLVPSSLVGWVITLRWWEHLQDNLCFSSNVSWHQHIFLDGWLMWIYICIQSIHVFGWMFMDFPLDLDQPIECYCWNSCFLALKFAAGPPKSHSFGVLAFSEPGGQVPRVEFGWWNHNICTQSCQKCTRRYVCTSNKFQLFDSRRPGRAMVFQCFVYG